MAATTSDLQGGISWNGNAAASVTPGLRGSRVAVSTAAGSLATTTLQLSPAGTATWTATSEAEQAQLSAFVAANTAKQFAKTQLNPDLPYLDQVISVTVNETGTRSPDCNAYSTGDDIHFLIRGRCENTALLADVVYHEFGHSLHAQSIIPGVGSFDSAMSEGLSDFLAALITGDNGMGRGFFFNNEALRDINPEGSEKRWPQDVTSGPHGTGEILGGTLWDLQTELTKKLGADAGNALTRKIYYSIMQRAPIMLGSFVEAIAADDNDGDLSNGTPNLCSIVDVFSRHGLVDGRSLLGLSAAERNGYEVSFTTMPPAGVACTLPSIKTAQLQWQVRGEAAANGTVEFTDASNRWSSVIPSQGDGKVIQYRVKIELNDGSKVSLPNNPADPFYEFYVGTVSPIWCADFENGAAGWTADAQWQVGAVGGQSGDPKTPFAGNGMYGLNLTNGGAYTAETETTSKSPMIDLKGFKNVRLQYRRWLGVEDSFYDTAKIFANGTEVWVNKKTAQNEQQPGVSHIDREWRFQDVDLSAQAATGAISLEFALKSDPGLELGGWTLDDVCLVTTDAAPGGASGTCGNGTVEEGESCDDGNVQDGDTCSATCTLPGEPGTGGNEDGGCCSSNQSPVGALGLGVGLMLLAGRRRRRVA